VGGLPVSPSRGGCPRPGYSEIGRRPLGRRSVPPRSLILAPRTQRQRESLPKTPRAGERLSRSQVVQRAIALATRSVLDRRRCRDAARRPNAGVPGSGRSAAGQPGADQSISQGSEHRVAGGDSPRRSASKTSSTCTARGRASADGVAVRRARSAQRLPVLCRPGVRRRRQPARKRPTDRRRTCSFVDGALCLARRLLLVFVTSDTAVAAAGGPRPAGVMSRIGSPKRPRRMVPPRPTRPRTPNPDHHPDDPGTYRRLTAELPPRTTAVNRHDTGPDDPDALQPAGYQ
jgi:hypothetical protein